MTHLVLFAARHAWRAATTLLSALPHMGKSREEGGERGWR
jgi:hypothetical protein